MTTEDGAEPARASGSEAWADAEFAERRRRRATNRKCTYGYSLLRAFREGRWSRETVECAARARWPYRLSFSPRDRQLSRWRLSTPGKESFRCRRATRRDAARSCLRDRRR